MTNDEQLRIGRGRPEVFLVCDKSLGSSEAPFIKWLRSAGFTYGGYQGNYGCWWVYIEISRKLYGYGMPGIRVTQAICDHAITIEEFKTIYNIYKKYFGKEVFVFYKERFDYDLQNQ